MVWEDSGLPKGPSYLICQKRFIWSISSWNLNFDCGNASARMLFMALPRRRLALSVSTGAHANPDKPISSARHKTSRCPNLDRR